jgi:hypothetical protein
MNSHTVIYQCGAAMEGAVAVVGVLPFQKTLSLFALLTSCKRIGPVPVRSK